MSAKRLLSAVYANVADLPQQVLAFIANGTDLDGVNEYGESPLRVASNNGRFEVVAMLVDAGADWYELAWTNTIQQTVFGTLDSMRASVLEHRDLEEKDVWGRTPFLIAVLLGDTAKAELLLELGAEPNVTAIGGKRAPAYAIQRGDLSMLQWLVDQGFDMEARDDFGYTPLMEAAALGQVACVRFLARHGVDLYKTGNTDQRALEMATDIAVVRALMEYGDDLTDLSDAAHAELLGVEYDGEPSCARAELARHGTRVFGTANPQRTDHPFWLEMIRCGANAWRARDRVGGDDGIRPVWCYQRFGRSTTILPDGRIIGIGGEHEDFYDPDFCIYNDVVVGDGKGHVEIYSYPSELFPPTDFHSATLAGNDLYIIGCLGYQEQRRPGFTPVYKLDLSTFRITALDTHGECPGWIYKHKARLIGTGAIAISGGLTETGNKSTQNAANEHIYSLCLDSMEWTRLPPR